MAACCVLDPTRARRRELNNPRSRRREQRTMPIPRPRSPAGRVARHIIHQLVQWPVRGDQCPRVHERIRCSTTFWTREPGPGWRQLSTRPVRPWRNCTSRFNCDGAADGLLCACRRPGRRVRKLTAGRFLRPSSPRLPGSERPALADRQKTTRHLQKCLELRYLTPYAVGHCRVAAYRVDLARPYVQYRGGAVR